MINSADQRVAVFIDTQNMYYSARNLFGQKVNFGNIVKEAVGNRKLIRARAYVVSTKTGEESAFFDALQKAGIETKEKQLMEYLSGVKKADWDVGITVDVISMLDMVDSVVLVSGDGDFVNLARFVQNHGRRFEVYSFRETTASTLVEAVDEYVNLSEDKRKFLMGKARKPASKMTRGGEALVEFDQASSVEKKPVPKQAAARKAAAKRATKKTTTKKTVEKKSTEETSRDRRLSF